MIFGKSTSLKSDVFIKKLQKERTDYNHASQVRMQAQSLLQLSVGIYTEPERFVYELLQNAVDAFTDTGNDSLNIFIRAEEGRFIFMHNGKAFDEKDVEGISDVGNGTKSKDSKKIGYKGIGFKSVFMPSVSQVTVISGDYCFEFNKDKALSLMPKFPIGEKPLTKDDVPWQVIPINSPKLREEFSNLPFNVITVVYTPEAQKIANRIEKLFSDLQFLLFLRSDNVCIRFERDGKQVFSVGKQRKEDSESSMPIVTLYRNDIEQSTWLLNPQYPKVDLHVPAKVKKALEHDFNTPDKLKGAEEFEISFAVQINGDKVVPVKNSSVFTFLPTSYKGLRQPFLINSNFITDAGRQQLHQESEWNKLIFSKIPELYLKFVACFSRQYSNYTEVLPTLYPDNDTLVGVYRESLNQALSSVRFVPNRTGNTLLKLEDVLVDETGISKGVVSTTRFLEHVNRVWNTSLTVENFVDDYKILDYAHDRVKRFGKDNLVRLLDDGSVISELSTSEDIKLIRFLYDYSTNLAGLSVAQNDSFREALRRAPFLLDEVGDLRQPTDLFFPSPYGEQIREASDVHLLNEEVYEWLVADQSILEWLHSIGLRDLSNMTFVIYLFEHPSYITKENAISVGRFLFDVSKKEGFLENKEYAKKIKDLEFLTKNGELRPISTLYLGSKYRPEDDMETVLPDGDLYVSDDYSATQNVDDWSYFLKRCGAGYKIGISERIYTSSERYDFLQQAAESFSVSRHHYTGYCGFQNPIINIKFRLNYFTFIDSKNPNYDLDRFVFSKVLSQDRNKWGRVDMIFGIIKYWGEYRGVGPVDNFLMSFVPYSFKTHYHSFLEYVLANEQCFPTTMGTSERPSDVYINQQSIKDLGGKYLPILNIDSLVHESWRSILPFKQSLTIEDLLTVLEGISLDEESEKEEKKERVSKIYREIIEREQYDSPVVSAWAKTHKLLSYSGEFLPPSELTYITVDGFKNSGSKVYCEKVGQANRDKLLILLRSFGINVITQKDITPSFDNQVENDEFKRRLLNKVQYIAIFKKGAHLDFAKAKTDLEEKISASKFFKCSSIFLSYGEYNDTTKSTFSKGECFYYTGSFSPARIEPLLSPLCKFLDLGSGNEGELMVVLLTDDHVAIKDYLTDKGYDVGELIDPKPLTEAEQTTSPLTATAAKNPEKQNAPVIVERGEEDGLSDEETMDFQLEAQKFLMKIKPKWRFPEYYGQTNEDGVPYNYSTVEVVTEKGVEAIVLKSYKKTSERFKVNPFEWEYLIKKDARLLIYTGDDIIEIKVRDLIQNQTTVNLSFSTSNLEIEERIDSFATALRYFKDIVFKFDSFNLPARVDSIRDINNTNEGTQVKYSDEESL